MIWEAVTATGGLPTLTHPFCFYSQVLNLTPNDTVATFLRLKFFHRQMGSFNA